MRIAVTEVVKTDADMNTGLELTIPLIPLLLDFNQELAGFQQEFDLLFGKRFDRAS